MNPLELRQLKKIHGNRQRGATLLVSLVILAIVTVLGVAGMRNSNMELKMAASTKDRSLAFSKAESVLRSVERDLSGEVAGVVPPSLTELLPTCSGARCFNDKCKNGLCFTGDFTSEGKKSDCSLADTNGVVKQMWKENAAVWEKAGNYMTKSVPNSDDVTKTTEVKYIVEFLCFVERDDIKAQDPKKEAPDNMVPLYRVTVRAEGQSGRASVMLQSVFRTNES